MSEPYSQPAISIEHKIQIHYYVIEQKQLKSLDLIAQPMMSKEIKKSATHYNMSNLFVEAT